MHDGPGQSRAVWGPSLAETRPKNYGTSITRSFPGPPKGGAKPCADGLARTTFGPTVSFGGSSCFTSSPGRVLSGTSFLSKLERRSGGPPENDNVCGPSPVGSKYASGRGTPKIVGCLFYGPSPDPAIVEHEATYGQRANIRRLALAFGHVVLGDQFWGGF